MESASSYVVPESLAVSESGFLFLGSTGETFTLNAIGKEIFTMLKEGKSGSVIKEAIHSEYDVDEKTLERDVDDFLNQLKSFKLVITQ
jgi:hypothetical protein